ncbi:MAG: sigma-54-dependent Fis family transcriptional regulator [Thermodesulfobacteriota bacterium]
MPGPCVNVDATTFERVRRERDLYLRLLQLGSHEQLAPFLQEALALIVEIVGARLAYLELYEEGAASDSMRWSATQGLSNEDVERVRSVISSGIIAEALATGSTIVTPSALLDPRFDSRASVRIGQIEAVLCTPIEAGSPLGVLYLQGHAGAGPFSDEDRSTVEIFAKHLAPLADRLLARHRNSGDATRDVRVKLRADNVIGRSESLGTLLREIALIAPLDVSVLLTGESGTGKSQIARVIHDNSRRSRGPFVELNCAALPETLVESELFGAMPGAHSTAVRRIEGKIAAAERGTLFLDEIGDLTLAAQAKLLQLLQSRQYYPLGSVRPVTADIRLIAATNVDLKAAVAERRFREDLLYRLQVLPLRLPTLAERREDIADLMEFFAGGACDRHGLPKLELSRNAIRGAELADWPGNVRQLAHAVEAAVIRATGEGARQIEYHHVFPGALNEPSAEDPSLSFQEMTRRYQARMLREALEANGWNVAQVAQRLDLARSHLYTLIRAFGLKRQDR